MADITTVGTLMINDALPEDMRREQWNLDKKGIKKLLEDLLEKHPDEYKDVLHGISEVGRTAAWTEGTSVSLAALRPSPARERVLGPVREQLDAIKDDDSLTPEQRRVKIVDLLLDTAPKLKDALVEEARAERNPFFTQIDSGARGGPGNLVNLRGGPLLVTDQNDQFLPVGLTRSFAEGLTPAQAFAGSYGQRKGMLAVKMCLCGETLVRMADWSVKPVKDIEPGEYVLGADASGVTAPARVVRRYDNGVRQCVRSVYAGMGYRKDRVELVSTPDHRVLTTWRSANADSVDLVPKQRPVSDIRLYKRVSRTQYCAVPAQAPSLDWGVPEPRAVIFGVMLGDGCSSTTSHTFSCADPLLLEDLKEPLRLCDMELVKTAHVESYTYGLRSLKKYAFERDSHGRITGTGHPLLQWFAELGMVNVYSYQKVLPDVVWTWDNKSLAELLGGLIATDGCITAAGNTISITLTLSSRSLVESYRELLRVRFGVYSSPVRRVKVRGCMRREQWTTSISLRNSVERFAALIPLPGVKKHTLSELLRVCRGAKSTWDFGYRAIAVEPAGTLPTYDLEVDNADHLFVLANGLVVSNSTAAAGFTGKKLANAAHRQVVTREQPEPTRLPVGLPVSVDDTDNIGAVLAKDAGKYTAGTILTSEILEELKDEDVDEVLVHSPMTEVSADGGISALAAGRRTREGLHLVGDNVGLPAAQAIGERLSQGSLSAKHSSGISDRISKSGLEYITRLLEAPEHFPEAGPLVEDEGVVEEIVKAPQGGHYIKVGKRKYYAGPQLDVTVKVGDRLEQGDDMTNGTPHPKQLIRLRGMGEARRVYLKELKEALDASGAPVHRRNAENVVAGLLNWARVTSPDGIGDSIYDDVVPYGHLTYNYRPRPSARETQVSKAIGQYLEEPVLHYTPGTRVTRKVADTLKKWGVDKAYTHTDAPDFEPEMIRSVMGVYHDPDWQTQQAGFYTASAFQKSLHRGAESDTAGTSYVPALAKGTGFGSGLKSLGKYGGPQ